MNKWLDSNKAVKNYPRIVSGVPVESNSSRMGFSASTAEQKMKFGQANQRREAGERS
jgi:hypothetical protein